MAQTVKSYKVISKNSIGGRMLTVTELELGTEYLTEGFVIEPTSLGLVDGLVDAAWCCNVVGPAKATTGVIPSVVVSEETKVKLQLYNTKTLKETELSILSEEASKGEKGKEMKVVLCTIGR